MDELGVEKFQNYLKLSSRRNYGSPYVWRQTSYDAFNDDISVVSFFFPTQRSVKFLSQASQTWTTYFSLVGGISGLLIGLSLITLFEIVMVIFTSLVLLFQNMPHMQLKR